MKNLGVAMAGGHGERHSDDFYPTPQTAAQAKAMLRDRVPHRKIADIFGVARSTIHAISQGRFHTDV